MRTVKWAAVLFALLLGLLIPAAALAETFGGLYDYTYYSNDYKQTISIPRALRVEQGRISFTERAGYSGTVDQWGGVTMKGPCPTANATATWKGVIRADGTGNGTYDCGIKGIYGTWRVSRVAGAGLSGLLDLDFDSPITLVSVVGAVFGVIIMAMAALPVAAMVGPGVAKGRGVPREQGPGWPSPVQGGTGYSVDMGRWVGDLPPVAAGQLATGPGAAVGQPEIAPLGFLTGTWTPGKVSLKWAPPQFDPSQNVLVGYTLSVVAYGPGSTAPVSHAVANLPPTATGVVHHFQGEIVGVRVDPVFGHVQYGNQVVSRAGGLFLRFGAGEGTLGL